MLKCSAPHQANHAQRSRSTTSTTQPQCPNSAACSCSSATALPQRRHTVPPPAPLLNPSQQQHSTPQHQAETAAALGPTTSTLGTPPKTRIHSPLGGGAGKVQQPSASTPQPLAPLAIHCACIRRCQAIPELQPRAPSHRLSRASEAALSQLRLAQPVNGTQTDRLIFLACAPKG